MLVLVNYDTRHEMGAASYEMLEKYTLALRAGKKFLELYIGGACMNRVIVMFKPIKKVKTRTKHEKAQTFNQNQTIPPLPPLVTK